MEQVKLIDLARWAGRSSCVTVLGGGWLGHQIIGTFKQGVGRKLQWALVRAGLGPVMGGIHCPRATLPHCRTLPHTSHCLRPACLTCLLPLLCLPPLHTTLLTPAVHSIPSHCLFTPASHTHPHLIPPAATLLPLAYLFSPPYLLHYHLYHTYRLPLHTSLTIHTACCRVQFDRRSKVQQFSWWWFGVMGGME